MWKPPQDPMFVPPLHRADTGLPCWPNQSRLVVFWTKDLSIWLGGYGIYGGPILFALMYIFERPLDNALAWIGYEDQFVSHFFFLREQYSYWVFTKKYDAINTTMFHVLEITIFVSIAMLGTRLVAGIVFLRQYDRLYLQILRTSQWKLKMYGAFPFGAVGIFVTLKSQWFLTGGALLFVLKENPNLVFFVSAVLYFYCGVAIVKTILFIIWKAFREKWPWAVLWHDNCLMGARES